MQDFSSNQSSGGSAKRASNDATDKVREEGEPEQILGEEEEGEQPHDVEDTCIGSRSISKNDFFPPKAISDGNEGCPHLVKVAKQGTNALVDFLLERGADIEATDRLFSAHFRPFLDF